MFKKKTVDVAFSPPNRSIFSHGFKQACRGLPETEPKPGIFSSPKPIGTAGCFSNSEARTLAASANRLPCSIKCTQISIRTRRTLTLLAAPLIPTARNAMQKTQCFSAIQFQFNPSSVFCAIPSSRSLQILNIYLLFAHCFFPRNNWFWSPLPFTKNILGRQMLGQPSWCHFWSLFMYYLIIYVLYMASTQRSHLAARHFHFGCGLPMVRYLRVPQRNL